MEWETPEDGIAEIADFPKEVLAEFSRRSNDIEGRLKVKVDRFHREPTVRERWRLEREAVLESQPAKPHRVSLTRLHEEWTERTRRLGHDPQHLVLAVLSRHRRLDDLDQRVATALTDTALRLLGEGQSTWRHAEIVRELAAAVPNTMAVDSVVLANALDGVADQFATTAVSTSADPSYRDSTSSRWSTCHRRG